MPFPHASGLPGAYDRTPQRPTWADVIARDGAFAQGADLNEAQAMLRRRTQRIGDMIGRDGDRVFGAAVAVIVEDAEELTGRIELADGLIYAQGDVRSVVARSIDDVEFAGSIGIGIRLVTTYVTEEDDDALLGLHPGSLSEGEPGSARSIETATWALATEEGEGVYIPVYQLSDGTVIDTTPPPNLSGIAAAIAANDRGATGGNYIVNGCRVTALGIVGSNQHFSIQEGEANIYGFKRTRNAALRHVQAMAWETETIPAEPHTFDDSGSGTATIRVNRGPIQTINSVLITKQVTETIVRGTPNNTADALGHAGATQIISVTQGATTYVPTTDYTLSANTVNWAPGGGEPLGGTSYQVTYRYLDTVAPSAVTADTFQVSGGVTGTQVLVAYSWRLPRVDLLGLDQSGNSVYLKGVPARDRPATPIAPSDVLALAELHQDWRGVPAIVNNGTWAMHFPLLNKAFYALQNLYDLMAQERLLRDIDSREPVAKQDVFVDPCINDYYRDQGEEQTAAVFNGSIQLAIAPTFIAVEMVGPLMLPYVEEVIIEQPRITGCIKINPYANFEPLPGALTISPSTDFWVETQTEWTSPTTQRISGTTNRTTATDVVVGEREELIEFLRPITVAFTMKGLGHGEILEELTFDGIDITPDPALVGDVNGEVSGTFAIPTNVTAGSKEVQAKGASGTLAWATFTGQGTIEITTMRRQTLIEVAPRPPTRPTSASQTTEPTGLWGSRGKYNDPQAQSFAPPRPRQVLGVDIWPCLIGNPNNHLLVSLNTMDNGLPTTDAFAGALVPMLTVETGEWLPARWPAPAYVPADRLTAFVIATDDNVHSISHADVGGFDAAAQQWVGAQPYTIGDRFDGSNAVSWLVHPGSDLTFRVVAAKFTATTRTELLGTFDIENVSDLMIAAAVELPSAECGFHFEVKRADGSVIVLLPYQNHEFAEYVTETIELRAVLTGTEFLSPTLFPGVLLIVGTLAATGTYVSRAFEFGTDIRLPVRFKALLPAGSGVTVEYDLADDDWTTIDLTSADLLNDGWTERLHQVSSVTGEEGRIRLTLAGTPAARPSLADLRATTTI